MSRRRAALPLIVSAALAACAIPIIAQAAAGNDLPDLRADAPANPYLDVYPDGRLLLRFDGYVTNVGTGPLDINGNPNGTMYQRVNDAGTLVNDHVVPVKYETADGHNHFHLMQIMRYSLRSGNAPTSPEVAPGQKVGFCLYDYNQATNFSGTRAPQVYALGRPGDDFCGRGKPGAQSLNMGVGSGWRDDYGSYLALQWVDVSDTTPGNYYLAADADPNNIIRESNETNPRAYMGSPVAVPGYVPKAIGPVTVPSAGSTDIPLAVDTFGSPTGLTYKVVQQPARGSVTIVGGAARYTPGSGAAGTYTFTYSAQSSSGYPRTARTATVTANVGATQAASVAISGAPASLVAGTSAQLAATVANAAQGVTWTASAGTISATGLYVAPAAPPAGGSATIRATSTANPAVYSEATIAITAPPAQVPAPLVQGSAGFSALTKPTITRHGRTIVVKVLPLAKGRINIAALRAKLPRASCTTATVANTRVTCTLRLPVRLAHATMRVRVVLRPAGSVRVVKSSLVKA